MELIWLKSVLLLMLMGNGLLRLLLPRMLLRLLLNLLEKMMRLAKKLRSGTTHLRHRQIRHHGSDASEAMTGCLTLRLLGLRWLRMLWLTVVHLRRSGF